MMDWKPIKDAPKDGRSVLLWARLKSASAEYGQLSNRWPLWQATPDTSVDDLDQRRVMLGRP
jgi:hypothetical protein